jgi:broad specificity phosphatase PhoE
VGRLVSSPLARARDTAEALGLGLPVEIDDRWIEVDYGEHEGRPLSDVPAEVWTRWRSDPSFRPEGGETLAEVGQRVAAACEGLFETVDVGARDPKADVVVVSHVSPIKAATCWALGLGDQGAWRLYLATASVTAIAWGPTGPVLHRYNETPWSARS